jgi:threonine/homoserine/homoserine lactone efflux protein
MNFGLFLRGLVIGLSIASQVGPMSMLCIRRTLTLGRLAGFVSGLGIASADALYGSLGGFGLTFVSTFLVSQQFGLRLVGGTFLCYIGIKTWLAKPAAQAATTTEKQGWFGLYLSTFLLTLTNPMTILAFAAILAGLGLGSTNNDYLAASILIGGIFAGSALWWFILSSGVNAFRTKITANLLEWFNRFSGLVIAVFGVVALFSLFNS